ncbi:MAG: SIMPL domain-containing protein [Burkholderiales bacterium]
MLLSLLAYATGPSLAHAQTPAPLRYNVVELSAEAQREVPNDLLAAQLYVEETNANPQQLAGALNRAVAEAVKVAREFPNVKLRTGNNQTYPVYPPRSTQPSGWRGRAEVRLETRDFAAGTALIGRLQGFMQLGNMGFSVSTEARTAAENELIAEAIAKFRVRAEIAQKALGTRAYKVQRIAVGTGASGPPPRVMMMARGAAMAEAGVPAPAAEGGATSVSVNINGAVELE